MKIKITRAVLIEASVQEFATEDVRQAIGHAAYEHVKNQDPHPLFVKLDVGRQGVSTGKTVVDGIRKFVQKIWSATRIKEMANRLNKGIPLFIGHGVSNSTSGRTEVGKTIKGWCEELTDGVHAFAVAWIPSSQASVQESIRGGDLDVCSIEASFIYSLGKLGKMFVDKITSLTAVALGSKKMGQMPGFATAGVVAQVQEMAGIKEVIDAALKEAGVDPSNLEIEIDEENGSGDKKKVIGSVKKRRKRLEDLTLGEMQVFVKNNKVLPTQIFSTEDLLNVKPIVDVIKAEVDERVDEVSGEKQTAVDNLQKELDKIKKDMVAKESELTKVNNDLKVRDEKIQKQIEELSPYKSQQRRDKISELVLKNVKLKDISKEQAKYIADHVSVGDDVDLEGDSVGEVLDSVIDVQITDIKNSGIKFVTETEKQVELEKEAGNRGDDGELKNPFIPVKHKAV